MREGWLHTAPPAASTRAKRARQARRHAAPGRLSAVSFVAKHISTSCRSCSASAMAARASCRRPLLVSACANNHMLRRGAAASLAGVDTLLHAAFVSSQAPLGENTSINCPPCTHDLHLCQLVTAKVFCRPATDVNRRSRTCLIALCKTLIQCPWGKLLPRSRRRHTFRAQLHELWVSKLATPVRRGAATHLALVVARVQRQARQPRGLAARVRRAALGGLRLVQQRLLVGAGRHPACAQPRRCNQVFCTSSILLPHGLKTVSAVKK